MRRLEGFWRALESIPGPAGLEIEWREFAGEDFEPARRFLRPTAELSGWYPCPNPGGEGCPRRVVRHGPGDIVAVCGDVPRNCDRLELQERDLILDELGIGALAEALGRALGFTAQVEKAARNLWVLGHAFAGGQGVGGQSVIVRLVLPLEEEDFEQAASWVLLHGEGPSVLLAPTARPCTASVRQALQGRSISFLPLDETMEYGEDGRLRSSISLSTLFEKPVSTPAAPSEPAFRKEGGYWVASYAGRTVHLKHRKGLVYLRTLLDAPHHEFHCVALRVQAEGLEMLPSASGEEVLDDQAVQEYREARNDLEWRLEQAQEHHDFSQREALQEQLFTLDQQLSSGLGLGGRRRRGLDDVEKHRKSVSTAINRAIENIGESGHPQLAQHLEASISRGRDLSYRPDSPLSWIVE